MKTTVKLTIILGLMVFLACGKKNATSNSVTLLGDGRSGRSVDEFSGQKHHLISAYFLINDAQKDKVGIYGQLRIVFPKGAQSQTAAAPKIQTMAAVVATPGKTAAAAVKPRPPTTPVPRTYYLFYEEYASCSDGPLGIQRVLINHGAPTGTASALGTTVTIPDIGTLSKVTSRTEPAYFSLTFNENIGATLKDLSKFKVKFNRWDSTLNLEALITAHQNYPAPQSDAGRQSQIDDVKKKCEAATKNSSFVDKIRPADASEPIELNTQQLQQQDLGGNNLQDKEYTPAAPATPDSQDFKTENSNAEDA